MAIIFDLDQTLVDSQSLLELRRARRWQAVYNRIPELKPFDGIPELLADLCHAGVPMCIVTSSPSLYCGRIIQQCKLPIPTTVCYHDTSLRKPHPAPILEALRRLNVPPEAAAAVGDDANDTIAARSAGVLSIGVSWGSLDRAALVASNPDVLCADVPALRAFLEARFRRP